MQQLSMSESSFIKKNRNEEVFFQRSRRFNEKSHTNPN